MSIEFQKNENIKLMSCCMLKELISFLFHCYHYQAQQQNNWSLLRHSDLSDSKFFKDASLLRKVQQAWCAWLSVYCLLYLFLQRKNEFYQETFTIHQYTDDHSECIYHISVKISLSYNSDHSWHSDCRERR
jgi:hypothetical protein